MTSINLTLINNATTLEPYIQMIDSNSSNLFSFLSLILLLTVLVIIAYRQGYNLPSCFAFGLFITDLASLGFVLLEMQIVEIFYMISILLSISIFMAIFKKGN